MIKLSLYIFWIGTLIIGYTYIGYGLIIYLLSKLKKPFALPAVPSEEELPPVTLFIAACNEEGLIAEKIKNSLSLDYPPEKLSIFIVTDGSSDRTPEIVAQFLSVQLFHEPQRKGKIHAVSRVMKFVKTPLVIYSDANTYVNPDAIRKIVRHYQDQKTGGVAGEKKIAAKKEDSASGSGEGLYWKYESFLKQMDSKVCSVVGAAGELFSIRTSLYEEPAPDMIIEDFYISVRIAMQGYRFIYEPEAYALENASPSVSEEWKRKVRISAGGFQAMVRLLPLLNVFRYGLLSFQYFSHRVLRWTLAPAFLPLIFIANVLLAVQGSFVYQSVLALQAAFYGVAFLGLAFQNKKIAIKGFFVPYYFSVMNISVYAGFFRFLTGRQSVVWEKSARATDPSSNTGKT